MENFFSAATTHHASSSEGVHRIVPAERQQRRIRRLYGPQDSEFQTLPRFGPLYASDEGPMLKGLKEMAWQHVLENTRGDREETTQNYLSAIRDVEREAMECYEDLSTDVISETEFRWMMLKDGCFLLQLVIMILGGSFLLEYPEDHVLFGRNKNVDTQRWTKSMFYVGNQIPLVVLWKLMKQPFYDRIIIKATNLKEPSDLFEKALYKLLLFPNNTSGTPSSSGQVTSLLQRLIPRKKADRHNTTTPSDLLHGLQTLVVCRLMEDQIEENIQDIDLELGDNKDVDDDDEYDEHDDHHHHHHRHRGQDHDTKFPSAKKLRQGGIHFRNVKETIGNGGIIYFKSRKVWAVLYMPTFTVDDKTMLVFKNVINYERIQQPRRKEKREFCGYLKFMSELVPTQEDVKLLFDKGIIKANSGYREKLPRILRALSDGESSEYLRHLRFQVNEYSQPTWWKYKGIISVALFFTVVQTVFGILSYVHDLSSS